MREKCKKMIDNDQRLYIEGNESVRDRPKEWNAIKNNVEVDLHCRTHELGGEHIFRYGQKYRKM